MTTRTPGGRTTTRRRGFSMAELIIAAFLTSLLGLLIGTAVATFVRPVVEIDGRARLAVEARLAAESLAQDLGGYLADGGGEPGDLTRYVCQWPPDTAAGLSLGFTAADVVGPIVVAYSVQDKQLRRRKTVGGVDEDVCVARYVSGFSAEMEPDQSAVLIHLSLTYPDAGAAASTYFSCTYQLVGVRPPS